jgi:hypothetical protein
MSKFKIPPKPVLPPSPAPATIQDFGAASALAKSQAGNRPQQPVRLNLDIDPALHRRIKQAAFDADVKISVIVRQWIEEGLARN